MLQSSDSQTRHSQICRYLQSSWEVNMRMSGLHRHIDKRYSKWAPGSIRQLMRQMRRLCTTLKNDMTLYRGTWSMLPSMVDPTKHVWSPEHNRLPQPTPLYVNHPFSTSTKRSIAAEFAKVRSRSRCCLHVITVSAGVAVLPSDVLYAICSDAAKRECEYIILPPVELIFIKVTRIGNVHWRCLPK
jgi:hypothetical protein